MDQWTITGGADFLQLSPAAAPVRGLTGWLADAIRAAIIDGRLRAGAPLPATRLLAGDLGVSRGVIVEAYQRLADEGLVSAPPRGRDAGPRGLAAGAGSARAAGAGAARATGRRRSGLSPRCCRSAGGRGRRSTSPPACPTCPGFRAPPGCAPKSWCSSRPAWPTSATAIPAAASGCGRELAGWLARTRGLRADPDDIIVVTGVAQALALLARVLQDLRRDRGRRPGLARGPRRAGLLGPAPGAGPGGRARAGGR